MPASRLLVPRGTLPNIASIVMLRGALRSSAPAIHGFATPLRISAALCHRMAKLSKTRPSRLLAEHLVATPPLRLSSHCRSSAERGCSVALMRSAFPPHCRAVLRHRRALHFRAAAHRVTAWHFLRLATPCYAAAHPIAATPFLRPAMPRKATPSLPESVHRRCKPRLCFATAPHRCAFAVRGTSWPSYSMPSHVGAVLLLRRAVHCVAPPSLFLA